MSGQAMLMELGYDQTQDEPGTAVFYKDTMIEFEIHISLTDIWKRDLSGGRIPLSSRELEAAKLIQQEMRMDF